jgi:uncharacterized HAD superfamily protein
MSKPKAVVIDLDDTSVGFSLFLCSLCNKIYGTKYIEKDIKEWELPKELHDLYKRFENHGLYSSLPLLPSVKEAIDYFSMVKKFKIIFLTARPESFGEETYMYLIYRDLKFDELIFNKDKVAAIRALSKKYHISLFVDDKLDTIEVVSEKCRVDTICLINKGHNQKDNLDADIIRVDSLFESIRYLK